MVNYGYYTGNKWHRSADVIFCTDPVNEQTIASFAVYPVSEMESLVLSAAEASREWRKVPNKEKSEYLQKICSCIRENLYELANLESLESGKPFKESLLIDVPLGADCFEYYANLLLTLQDSYVLNEQGPSLFTCVPYGVCGIFLPYNVPMMIFGFSCAAALAAGNSLIIKPSEFGALSLCKLAEHLSSLDLPEYLINIIHGTGDTVGSKLASSSVNMLSFTGSRETLTHVIRESYCQPKKIICELGGCNIAAVFNDCDFDEAVQNVLGSSFMKSGQMCIGTDLILVEKGISERFIEILADKAEHIAMGDPMDPLSGIGPLRTSLHRINIHNQVSSLINSGATVLCGAEIPQSKGFYYPPTILLADNIAYKEIFGPVVQIAVMDREEMISSIENNPTGLTLQLWTKDSVLSHDISSTAACGMVWVNSFGQMSSQTPFGGSGQSGWGRQLGVQGFYEYTQTKHIGTGIRKSPVSGWFGL